MKLVSKLIVLCYVVLVFPGFAMSMDVAELIKKANAKEADNENKIGSFVRVEM